MEHFKKQFAEIFELSPEIIMDLPLIMFVGQQKVYIENHKGILAYNEDQLKIRVKANVLTIKGEKLLIDEIKNDSLTVSGCVVSLLYQKGTGGERHD